MFMKARKVGFCSLFMSSAPPQIKDASAKDHSEIVSTTLLGTSLLVTDGDLRVWHLNDLHAPCRQSNPCLRISISETAKFLAQL